MNNKPLVGHEHDFQQWLCQWLQYHDFYLRRGDHYLLREFAKWCNEHGHPIDEASLGRYVRTEHPVIPTPIRLRSFAALFHMPYAQMLVLAGYATWDDLRDVKPYIPRKLRASVKATEEA